MNFIDNIFYISLFASEAKRRRRSRLRVAEQAHSHVMGSENSTLTPKIYIFRKNGTDEKNLIFGCEIDIQNLKNRPGPGRTEPGRAGPGRFFFLLHISILHPKIGLFSSVHFFRKINILGVSALLWA